MNRSSFVLLPNIYRPFSFSFVCVCLCLWFWQLQYTFSGPRTGTRQDKTQSIARRGKRRRTTPVVWPFLSLHQHHYQGVRAPRSRSERTTPLTSYLFDSSGGVLIEENSPVLPLPSSLWVVDRLVVCFIVLCFWVSEIWMQKSYGNCHQYSIPWHIERNSSLQALKTTYLSSSNS